MSARRISPFESTCLLSICYTSTERSVICLVLWAELIDQSLLSLELKQRRELLKQHFHPVEGEFDFAKSSDGHTTDEIQTFLEESVKDGCEGLMVKMLTTESSTYEPSRRSINWLKASVSAVAEMHTD